MNLSKISQGNHDEGAYEIVSHLIGAEVYSQYTFEFIKNISM